jgi:hypothetical protein
MISQEPAINSLMTNTKHFAFSLYWAYIDFAICGLTGKIRLNLNLSL